jgi:hypothetical protein
MAAFFRDAGADWRVVTAAIREKVAEDYHAERAKPLSVDWFLRPKHREGYVEAGVAALGGPSSNGDAELLRTAQARAEARGLDPAGIYWDESKGIYRHREA